MLHAVFSKSWKLKQTKQQLYGHLHPVSQTIWVRWVRHAGHYQRSKNKLISNVLQWTPTHGHNSLHWPAITYIHQLWADIGFCLEDLKMMTDGDKWQKSRESVLLASLDNDYDNDDCGILKRKIWWTTEYLLWIMKSMMYSIVGRMQKSLFLFVGFHSCLRLTGCLPLGFVLAVSFKEVRGRWQIVVFCCIYRGVLVCGWERMLSLTLPVH